MQVLSTLLPVQTCSVGLVLSLLLQKLPDLSQMLARPLGISSYKTQIHFKSARPHVRTLSAI